MRERKRKKSPEEKISYSSSGTTRGKRLLINTLEMASGRRKVEKRYREILNNALEADIWSASIERLELDIRYNPEHLATIPAAGPIVFVANHPFGIVDGLALGYLVSRVRQRFKVMVNEVLARNPLLQPYLLPVDFRETKAALAMNLNSRKEALEALRTGEALAIFPAGGVATSRKPWGKAEDLEWKRFVAKAIQDSQATVVPIFFHGQNSRLFQVASNVSTSLRLGLFLHEAKNKMGRTIRVEIGAPIPFADLRGFSRRQTLLDHLRKVTFALGE